MAGLTRKNKCWRTGEQSSRRDGEKLVLPTFFEPLDRLPLQLKLKWVFITLMMGVPGSGLFSFLFLQTALIEVEWSATARSGMAVGGIAALAVALFMAAAGVRIVTGPQRRLDGMLNVLKWPFYAIILLVLGYIAVVIGVGVARGA